MLVTAPIAYKGFDSMPSWFVVLVVVLAMVGIVLAYQRRR